MIYGGEPTSAALAICVLMLVGTLCWCWRERSRRKSIKEIEQERRQTLSAILGELRDRTAVVEPWNPDRPGDQLEPAPRLQGIHPVADDRERGIEA
jgi:hypothetical protein